MVQYEMLDMVLYGMIWSGIVQSVQVHVHAVQRDMKEICKGGLTPEWSSDGGEIE